MEKFKELVLKANKYLKNADHMLYMTYPLIKDVKLLISIADNVDKALKTCVVGFLYYDWIYKRIMNVPEGFERKLELFKKISAKRYGFSLHDINLLKDLDEIMVKHKKSPVEFVKNDKFVISYNQYKIRTLDYEDVKDYVLKAKPFIVKLNNTLRNDPLVATGRGRGD